MGYSKHVYDIDLIGILNELIHPNWRSKVKFKSELDRQKFIDSLKTAAELAIDCDSNTLEKLLSTQSHFIYYPTSDESVYHFWLAQFLSIQDPSIVPLILIHHWTNLKFQMWFLDHLEHRVIKALPSEDIFDISEHKKEIISWIHSQRENKIHKIEFEERENLKLPSEKIDSEDYENLKLPSEKIDSVFNTLKTFVNDENSHKDLFELLTGNKITKPILIRGTIVFFVAIFEKLHHEKIIIMTKRRLSEWLYNNFIFHSSGSRQKASEEYILRMLSTKYSFTKSENTFLDPIFRPDKFSF